MKTEFQQQNSCPVPIYGFTSTNRSLREAMLNELRERIAKSEDSEAKEIFFEYFKKQD